MRNSRIHRPNVVTRRAAAEPKGAVTRYREVRPNNNNKNNNHASLAELFQPITLLKLRQLGIYNNTDTSDTAHQLDTDTVTVEVAYTMTNTQPSYSEEGELDHTPNTFKGVMGFPREARWKIASDKEIASLKKHGVFELVPITSVFDWQQKLAPLATRGCRLALPSS